MYTIPAIHLAHVLMLLQALDKQRREPVAGALMPQEVFVLRAGEERLWELVGFRLRGLDSLMLAGVEFPRQTGGAGELPRQSLVSFLASPVRHLGVNEAPRPPHLLEVALPDPRTPILSFLERGRAGEEFPTALVDRADIELAFDFRLDNPSRLRFERSVATLDRRHLFRTTAGHLLTAVPHELPRKLHRDDDFLALRRPTQHTAAGDHTLPTMVFHRRQLTMTAPLTGTLTPWLSRTLPFHVDLAVSDHLLDRRLESYRFSRERLLEDEALKLRSA